ncbi:MAG: elongation factor 1-beta [Candidatus Syntropharchaeales archaeon]|nr:elongation factor 1-beta [Candidatus Syntrophoarchaeum sp.]
MGEVAAHIKVMPEGVETDLARLREKLEAVLPEGVRLHGFKEEPIAFGLKALMVTVILADMEGGTERIEGAFADVEGVESVQVTEVGLI